jgi:NAD(P)-dependent dehydrogenase (short-subunit alcohol dehydrogenase family)
MDEGGSSVRHSLNTPVDQQVFQTIFNRLFSLQGRGVLLTGATGGIGRVFATAVAEAGACVAVTDLDLAQLEELRQQVERTGGQAVSFATDLGDVDACRQVIQEAYTALGRLDILVNCAAVNRRKAIQEVTLDDFETIVDVNLRSIYFLCQAVYPIMRAQSGGKIVNIGSVNSFFGLDTVSVYGLTKGAVSQLTKVMAVEWAQDNIQVNCLAPGFVRTPLSTPLWTDPQKSEWLRSRIPARRPCVPEELVGALLLLASPASDYITGQTFVVDGGFLAGGSWDPDKQ